MNNARQSSLFSIFARLKVETIDEDAPNPLSTALSSSMDSEVLKLRNLLFIYTLVKAD